MTAGGPWIGRIDVTVGEPIEGHRRAAGKDHAKQNADQFE
jgi:hypothetical protein